jgi:hypothetical protein
MRILRIHHQAGLGMAAMAIETKAARNIEWENDAVTFLYALDRVAYFIDYAHNFVPNRRSLFQGSAAVIHMQIAAANSGSCHPEDGVGG